MTSTTRVAHPTPARTFGARIVAFFDRIPHDFIALLGRFSIAAVFWNSGQTKITGLAINFVTGDFVLGWPRLSDTAIGLFRDEFRLPLVSPSIAAHVAAFAEHIFPVMLLIGLATRLSALALLVMTLVVEVLVYPDAYPVHGTWATILLYLMARGPGVLSIDHLIGRRFGSAH